MKKCMFFGVFILLLMAGCQSEMDKYYELPDWLKGNAYEVLKGKENFTMFLEAVDKTDYKDLVGGKGIVTVIAPTDEAFKAYLTKRGINSISEMSKDELNKLIGFHLVYYSYSKGDFWNYNPLGVDEVVKYPGMYYKFRTKSRDAISTAIDYASDGVSRKIMRKERFVPVYTEQGLKLSGDDAKSDYETLFPGSTWTAGADGFNIANASVNEYAIVTDNGYVYTVDQVLEPLETIYTEMSNGENSDYTTFAKLYDRFTVYKYDEDATTDYGNGDSLFVHSHKELPPIDCEWTNLSTPDYAQMGELSAYTYIVTAPGNQALDNFFTKYWASYYQNWDEVNDIPLYHLMSYHALVYGGGYTAPSSFARDIQLKDTYDGQTVSNPDYIKVCSNGILYGMKDNVITPEYFVSPASPALCNPAYNMFVWLMHKGNVMKYFNYGAYQKSFDVFYPTNEMLKNSEFNGELIQYLRGNVNQYGSERILVANSDGEMVDIKSSQAEEIANAHVSDGKITSRTNGGVIETIYSTLNDYEYLYQVGDLIYSSLTWNASAKGGEVSVTEIEEVTSYGFRGNAYKLKGDAASASLLPDHGNFKDRVTTDQAMNDFKTMRELYLTMSTVDKTVPAFNFLQGNRFIIFIPTYAAAEADIVNGTLKFPLDGDRPDMYVKSMFVNTNASGLLEYPFPGALTKKEMTLTTFGTKTVNGKKEEITVTLIDKGDKLVVRDAKGNEANVISYFPYIYADGAAYIIDGVLDLLN